ncbi:hypothetical protein L484_009933 [Morus notabilis]|uniref:Gnk2-homologous domain-containing protein n=1 Tax=Morus notabilis TaxID=981085 RepID=W9SCN1_9ROSA|nr:hypothetical protein L484_009933 [Morus notabilis]
MNSGRPSTFSGDHEQRSSVAHRNMRLSMDSGRPSTFSGDHERRASAAHQNMRKNKNSLLPQYFLKNILKAAKVVLVMFWWWLWLIAGPVGADPQTRLLNQGCSQYKAMDLSDFYASLNAAISDLKAQLRSGKHFATAQQSGGSDSVYAMAQCRNYLSTADCTACFTIAEKLRNCPAANGARVVYDGCFLSTTPS